MYKQKGSIRQIDSTVVLGIPGEARIWKHGGLARLKYPDTPPIPSAYWRAGPLI